MSDAPSGTERVIPAGALVVLVGPSGAGKSTWAAEHFRPDVVVSSDGLRAVVGEGPHDLRASADAFALVEDIVRRRVRRGLTTVLDSLGLDAGQRAVWRGLAEAAGRPVVAVLFETSAAECRRRNAARPDPVPADVVRSQLDRWPAVVEAVRSEPWHDLLTARPVAVVPASLAAGSPPATIGRSRITSVRSRPDAPGEGAGRVPDPAAAPTSGRVGRVEIGLHLSGFAWPGGAARLPEHLGAIARHADAVGVAHLWLMDHLRQIPQVGPAWQDLPDPFTTLAWLAARTERVRLGVLVSPAFLRPAAALAKAYATLDVLSGGRAICGLGVGWFAEEYRAAGIEFPDLDERYERLDDTAAALRALWGKGAPPFEGERISVPETLSYPRPLQDRLPIWIGGSGERRTLRLVARHADGCNLFGEPDVVARKVAALHRHCEELGRDPATIRVSHLSTVLVGRDRAETAALVERLRPRRVGAERFAGRVNAGTIEDHAGRVERFAAAGVDTMIVSLADVAEPDAVDRLGALIARLPCDP